MISPDFLFLHFLVFPPANPSNFSLYPDSLSFSVQIVILYVQSGTSRTSMEVQDEKTGL